MVEGENLINPKILRQGNKRRVREVHWEILILLHECCNTLEARPRCGDQVKRSSEEEF